RTSASVSAIIDPHLLAAGWSVQYGATTAYGTTTALASLPAGGAQTVMASLTGLTPGTTYHYRISATSSSGTGQSADGIFTTAAPVLPGAVTAAATGVGRVAATLNGIVTPNDADTTYAFEYGPKQGYGQTTAGSPLAGSAGATPVSASL